MVAAASVTYLGKDQGKGKVEGLNMVGTEAFMFQEDHDEENGEVTPGKPRVLLGFAPHKGAQGRYKAGTGGDVWPM